MGIFLFMVIGVEAVPARVGSRHRGEPQYTWVVRKLGNAIVVGKKKPRSVNECGYSYIPVDILATDICAISVHLGYSYKLRTRMQNTQKSALRMRSR